jgi:endonuclease/exonuclease/phosphatase family metal-dependent hydrolase
MTFNLRYASDERPNSWAERRPVMRKVILDQSPDVIGTQEGLYPQLKDLARDLPAYDWIGLGREGGSRGEFMAVFYRRDRFEPMAFDHFWLSDTPNLVGSSTWGNENRRMVTWVRFRDRQSRREFFVWNTHLDHEIETARQKAAALIRERIVQADPAIPLLLVGDFNCAAGASKAFEILTGDGLMADAWRLAERRINDGVNSFNGFRTEARRQGVRIDWILLRGKGAQVARAEIVTYADKGQFPSDHFPVVADIRFEEQS